MTRFIIQIIFFILITYQNLFSLITPIRTSSDKTVILAPCDEIKLVYEQIDLYHHPLGIWLITYEATLENLRVQSVSQMVCFPSGFDIRMVERDLICDYFENFRVFVNDQEVKNIQFLIKCSNFVKATGIEWTMDDEAGTGFVNTWLLHFKPEEMKHIKITFSFIVKKPPIVYNPNNHSSWYRDLMNWLKQDYSMREENQFKLPINLGSFWALYPDSMVIRSYFAHEWLKIVNPEERVYPDENIVKYEFSEPYGFYSPPSVELVSPTTKELTKMSKTELFILKNSFVAKYGKSFKNHSLKLFFNHQPWYSPNPYFHVWYLNEWDIDNIKMINEFEKTIR